MRTVYFANQEPIDLAAVAVMGVSVKTGDNPIGFFGTGLKFAIATLLRTGHEIRLEVNKAGGSASIRFITFPVTIRGETFEQVRMEFNEGSAWQDLGFTTQLGRNWEDWQAYRELRCNCTDEGGVIATELLSGDFGTVFMVTGEGIAKCHASRHEVFLDGVPAVANDDCEIHRHSSRYFYYRGVRALDQRFHSIFTYNLLEQTELTEDRTIKNFHAVEWAARDLIVQCEDDDLIYDALMAPRGSYEAQFSYESASTKPSNSFMRVCQRLRNDHHANHSAIKLWLKHAAVESTYTDTQLDAFDEDQIARALMIVSRLGADVKRGDFIVVDSLGEGIYGSVRRGQILIARGTLDLGVRFIASTIYEEHLHKKDNMKDESRALQNLLFEKLFAMAERVMELERELMRRAA